MSDDNDKTPNKKSIIVKGLTPEEWAKEIKTSVADAVGGIVRVGEKLIQARQELGEKRYMYTLHIAGMHERTARRYVSIARHPILSNPAYARHLPVSMRTLSELATLSAERVEQLIQGGLIHPEIERKDVPLLAAPGHTNEEEETQDEKGPPGISNVIPPEDFCTGERWEPRDERFELIAPEGRYVLMKAHPGFALQLETPEGAMELANSLPDANAASIIAVTFHQGAATSRAEIERLCRLLTQVIERLAKYEPDAIGLLDTVHPRGEPTAQYEGSQKSENLRVQTEPSIKSEDWLDSDETIDTAVTKALAGVSQKPPSNPRK